MPWWSIVKQDTLNEANNQADNGAEAQFGREAFALTCLALELAMADDSFDSREQGRLRADLAHHFDLSEPEVSALIAAAQAHQARSVEAYSLTRKLRESLSEEERVVVIETLWRLAYADGVLDGEEFAFMRRLPAALGIENYISEAARRRAMSALSYNLP